MTTKRILLILLGFFIIVSDSELFSEKKVSVTLSIDINNLSDPEKTQIKSTFKNELTSKSGLVIESKRNINSWRIDVLVAKMGKSITIAAKLFNPNGTQVFLKTYSDLTDVKAVQNHIPNLVNEIYQKMNLQISDFY